MPTKSAVGADERVPAEAHRRLDRDLDRRIANDPAADWFRLGEQQVERGHRHDAGRHAAPGRAASAPRARSRPRSPRRRASPWPRPRPARSRRRRRRRGSPRPASVRSCGSAWRVSASTVGPSLRSSASCQHSAVSTASAGRKTRRFGMARKRRKMLDRLMRRSVLAEADRVVRHDVDRRDAGQRRDADRRPRIIGEDQEGRAGRAEAAMERKPVHGRRHAVLADAVMDVAPAILARRDDGQVLGLGVVRRRQVGRAEHELGHRLGHDLERDLARLAGRDRLRLGDEPTLELGDRRGEPGRRLALDAPLELGTAIGREAPRAASARPCARAGRAGPPAPRPCGSPPGHRRRRRSSRAPPWRRQAPPPRAARHAPSRCRPSSARRSRSWSCRRSASAGPSAAPGGSPARPPPDRARRRAARASPRPRRA